MAAHEEGPRQVIKPLPTFFTPIAAALLLTVILASLVGLVGQALRTMHPIRPTFLSNFFVTLVLVYELVEAAHGR